MRLIPRLQSIGNTKLQIHFLGVPFVSGFPSTECGLEEISKQGIRHLREPLRSIAYRKLYLQVPLTHLEGLRTLI